MIYIGIDPGSKSGAYAIMDDVGAYVFPWDDRMFIESMKVIATAREGNKSAKAVVCLEKVNAMPKQGVKSTWVFAENFGFIQGVLHALGIPYQLVPPRVWKKEYSLTSDKAQSVEACRRLFPDVNLKRTERSRKDDNNFAEAVLMALYAKRKLG